MAAIKSVLLNLLVLISISAEISGIDISDHDVKYHTKVRRSLLRDQHVVILYGSERYRRQASNPPTTQLTTPDSSPKNGSTAATVNTTTNDVNRTTSSPPPQTSPAETTNVYGTHSYYDSIIMKGQADNYWVPLGQETLRQDLTSSHMMAQTIQFEHPPYRFYGQNINNVTITTGGFLYMSPFVHSMLTATQYTAPLMGNFHTEINISNIFFKEYDDKFVAEWRDVFLVDQMDLGPFKFETILHRNGTILFVYQKVPVPISNISTSNHPVKIGLADAFYIDRQVGFQIFRTIYNYNTIKIDLTYIKEKTVVILNPRPTCNLAKDCTTCITQQIDFVCLWCDKVQRCSNQLDWNRQDWNANNCPTSVKDGICNPAPPAGAFAPKQNSQGSSSDGGVIAVVVVLVVIVLGAVIGLFVYAYRNPTSAPGQWLIEHRPSALREKWRNVNLFKRDSGEKYKVEMDGRI